MARLVRRHDQFFKKLLDQPEAAGALLRERLPAALVQRLAAEPPELVPGTFVDEALREYRTDRLYRVHLTDGRPALIYALVEHKSAPDRHVGLQLLGYMAQIWQHWLADAPNRRHQPLPPIFPLVVHTGRRSWDVPLLFAETLDLDPGLRPHALDFPYTLLDLSREPDASLSHHRELRVGLLILKRAAGEGDLRALLREVGLAAAALGLDDLVAAVRYILAEPNAVDTGVLTEVLKEIVPGREADIMSIAAEQWKAEGRSEGRAEGKAEGLALGETRGKAESLLRLLERRFSPVPNNVRARVLAADGAQLDQWLDNLLDAPDLETVFSTRTTH